MQGLFVFIVCAVLMSFFSGFVEFDFGRLQAFGLAFICLFYTYWTSGRERDDDNEKDGPP